MFVGRVGYLVEGRVFMDGELLANRVFSVRLILGKSCLEVLGLCKVVLVRKIVFVLSLVFVVRVK